MSDSSNSFLSTGISAAIGAALLCAAVPALAETNAATANPRIDELVVTGMRSSRLAELPRSAYVITADDIALSPSMNIVDLIAREANVQLRSFTGNDKASGIDVRGQGDTFNSNVLVLVDGIRLNASDQSGADYSTVPLDQVDRIEVVRGANSVRYGGGAVGGVINIITRRAEVGVAEGVKANARLRGGSYSTIDTGIGGSWAGDMFSVAADVAYYDTEGYRDNGDLEKKDVSARIGFDPVDWFGLALGGIVHRDKYGLPGPVSFDKYNGSDEDRRSTQSPNDGGSTDDDRVRLDMMLGNQTSGEFVFSVQNRDRTNPYVLSGTEGVINEDRQTLDTQYTKGFNWLGQDHAFHLGADTADVKYSREVVSTNPDDTKRGDIRQQAWFTAIDVGLSDVLKFSTGYRQDSFRIKNHRKVKTGEDCQPAFPPFPPQCTDIFGYVEDNWRNSAAEAGLVYSPADNTNWFLSFSQSFRNPNVDDLIDSDDDLQPQSADNWDAGVRQYWADVLELSFAVFYSKTKNEILYGLIPDTGQATNRNADQPTKRTGGELSGRWYLLSSLTLTGNAGYTKARFEETGTYIPLVPEWTAGLGVQWSFLSDWVLDVSGNYVGERYEGNDFGNNKPRLDSYVVVDTKLSWEIKNVQLFAGINNLFDEIYSPSVYSGSYYPMPGRNYSVGVNYRLGN